ncbi:MAG: hypothetical protein IKS55_02540 [Oscillospiraceae bacterium]|nr:hypothetical protein [Oscillospiraceae bacterium]
MDNEKLFLAEAVTDFIRESNWLNGRDIRTLAQLRDSVVCKNSQIGEFKCYVELIESRGPGYDPKIICVDTCLQHEIFELRRIGINTIGCCCGHGRKEAYIQVSPQSVKKMHELGYEQLPEHDDGQGKWCFKPKTYLLEPVRKTYKFDKAET